MQVAVGDRDAKELHELVHKTLPRLEAHHAATVAALQGELARHKGVLGELGKQLAATAAQVVTRN